MTDSSRFEALREVVAAEMARLSVPSLSVAVAEQGEPTWEHSFGYADPAAEVAATPDTVYALASITKAFTGAAVMRLHELGAVDLDEPVNRYLAGAAVGGAGIAEPTVRQVANHTAGLGVHYHFFYDDEPATPPPRPVTFDRYAVLVAPPGERFCYSNLAYGILEHVVASASGVAYEDYLEGEVFGPLGLAATSARRPGSGRPVAVGYGADGVAYPGYDFDHRGASAAYGSVRDLRAFGMFLAGHGRPATSVLSDAGIAEMSRSSLLLPAATGYGVGVRTYDTAWGAAFGHDGGMGGTSTSLRVVPSAGVVVAMAANRSGLHDVGAHGTSALDRVREAVLHAVLGPPRRKVEPTTLRSALPSSGDDDEPVLETWEGVIETYAGEVPVGVEVRGDEVVVTVGSQPPVPLRRAGDAVRSSVLVGSVDARLPTDDAARRPHELAVDLVRRDGTLTGAVTAVAKLPDGEGGAPWRRLGSALTHRAELHPVARLRPSASGRAAAAGEDARGTPAADSPG